MSQDPKAVVRASAFDRLPQIAPQQLFEGIAARSVRGERITLAVVELDPDAVVAEHSHENEQLGIVLEGVLTLRIGDEERTLGPGETWCIAPHVVHEGRAGPEGAVVIDVFSPPRGDWEALGHLEAEQPRWPGPP